MELKPGCGSVFKKLFPGFPNNLFRTELLTQYPAQDKKKIGQPVEVLQNEGFDRLDEVQCYYQPFGTAAHRSGDVTKGHGGMPARQDKVFKRRQPLFHFINMALQHPDIFPGNTGQINIFGRISSEAGTNGKEAILNLFEPMPEFALRYYIAQHSHITVQFVHRTISIYPEITFGHSPPSEQSSLTGIAGFCVYFKCHF